MHEREEGALRRTVIVVGVVVAALGAAAIVALTVSPVRDEVEWRWASLRDSATSYGTYVEEWPNGRHANEAARKYDDAVWEAARDADRVDAYEAYLRELPDGTHADEAGARADDIAWEAARSDDTVGALGAYTVAYPDGSHVEEARDRIEEIHWEDASRISTADSYSSYLDAFPDGAHADEARLRIDVLRWDEATAANTVVSYLAYLGLSGEGAFEEQARNRIATLRRSNEPFLDAQRIGTEDAYRTFLAAFPGHRRAADARAGIRELSGVNIFDLIAQGKITVNAEGSDITEVRLRIKRAVPRPITVKIPIGTFFAARGSFQNMVATAPQEVTLNDNRAVEISVDAACANRTRAIPHGGDGFDVQRSPAQAELRRVVPKIRNEPYDVRQAAIWIITDNANFVEMAILIDQTGTPVILGAEAIRAAMLVDRAGIDVTQKKIWMDVRGLRVLVEDPEVKSWLRKRLGNA